MPHLRHGRPDKAGAFRHPGRYDRIASRYLRRLYAQVAADIGAGGLPDDAQVLDVGTGPGRLPLAIAETAPGMRIEGIDLSEEMIEHARQLAANTGKQDHVNFAVEDVADLPYPDNTYDLIVSTLSQHHWTNREAGVRELLRVLKPGGQIWIYDIRFALRRATATARSTGAEVRRHTLRTGPLTLGLLVRLTINKPR